MPNYAHSTCRPKKQPVVRVLKEDGGFEYERFYLPVALAVSTSPNSTPPGHKPSSSTRIIVTVGVSFQTQDDLSTLPSRLSRSGGSARMSWRRVLNGNHERKNSECERRVLEVFESSEVDLKMTSGMYEEGVYRELVAMIGEIPGLKGKSILKEEVFKRFVGRP
ncbi:hypothetical protein IW261DRAFT_1422858 [Armillaria novae-zelandiae]|uniref:Uncharacterized protein n=1 Tax=Armillaria novae-zelandiae TaxID=153914 RepID=A0AA39NZ51_9AGAR|nr:hypothetical protein IW261DRAFT_1422858 [Armillaria novae-zelandiae]